jgi:putative hydrolase of the HAD superfamily
MANTVLFDLFGVIAHNQSPHARSRLAYTAGAGDAADPAFWDAYWRLRPPYDQGLTTGPGYWQHVAHALGTIFGGQRIAELIAADIASWSTVDETMLDILDELASSGCRLALLSNIPEEVAAHYEHHHAWLDRFQVRAFSCRIGHVKPQPAAFQWCLDALGVSADQVLFIDDRRENIQAAYSLGMQGLLFTNPAQLREHLLLERGTYHPPAMANAQRPEPGACRV